MVYLKCSFLPALSLWQHRQSYSGFSPAPSPPANEIPGVFVSGFSCQIAISGASIHSHQHRLPALVKSSCGPTRISDKSWDWLLPLLAQQQHDDCGAHTDWQVEQIPQILLPRYEQWQMRLVPKSTETAKSALPAGRTELPALV